MEEQKITRKVLVTVAKRHLDTGKPASLPDNMIHDVAVDPSSTAEKTMRVLLDRHDHELVEVELSEDVTADDVRRVAMLVRWSDRGLAETETTSFADETIRDSVMRAALGLLGIEVARDLSDAGRATFHAEHTARNQ